MFVEFGAACDGEQRGLIVRRELPGVGRGSRRCGFDGLQGGEHLPSRGVPSGGSLLQLVHGAVDAREQGAVDVELAAGQTAEEPKVESDADLGIGQFSVPVDQLRVRFVEDAAVAVGPQGVDVVPRAASRRWSSGETTRRVLGAGSGGIGDAPCVQRVGWCAGLSAGRGRPGRAAGGGPGRGTGVRVVSCGERERAAWVRALSGRRVIPRRRPTSS